MAPVVKVSEDTHIKARWCLDRMLEIARVDKRGYEVKHQARRETQEQGMRLIPRFERGRGAYCGMASHVHEQGEVQQKDGQQQNV